MSSLFLIDSDEPQPSNTTTTIVGVTYDDGVILGSTDTITQLANIFSCHSALEAEPLLKDARNFILDQDKNTMIAAETIGTMLSAYEYYDTINNMLQTGVIISGGKKIYEISVGGVVMEKSNFGVGGYGAACLNNFLNRKWKKGMNEEEAEKLVLKALSLNISPTNISLGGGVQTASVNSKGVTRAFHPYDTLTIRQPELNMDGKALLECVRARLILLRQPQ